MRFAVSLPLSFLLWASFGAWKGGVQVAASSSPFLRNFYQFTERKVSESKASSLAKSVKYNTAVQAYGLRGFRHYMAAQELFDRTLPTISLSLSESGDLAEYIQGLNEILEHGKVVTSTIFITGNIPNAYEVIQHLVKVPFNSKEFWDFITFKAINEPRVSDVPLENFAGMESILPGFDSKGLVHTYNSMDNAVKAIFKEYVGTPSKSSAVNFYLNELGARSHLRVILMAMDDGDELLCSYYANPEKLFEGKPLVKPGIFSFNISFEAPESLFVGYLMAKRTGSAFSCNLYTFGPKFQTFYHYNCTVSGDESVEELQQAIEGIKGTENLFQNGVQVKAGFKTYGSDISVVYTPIELLCFFLIQQGEQFSPHGHSPQNIFLKVFQTIMMKAKSPISIDEHVLMVGLIRKFYVLCFPSDPGALMEFKVGAVKFDSGSASPGTFLAAVSSFFSRYKPGSEDENGNTITDPFYAESVFRFFLHGYRNVALSKEAKTLWIDDSHFKRDFKPSLRKFFNNQLTSTTSIKYDQFYMTSFDYQEKVCKGESAKDVEDVIANCAREASETLPSSTSSSRNVWKDFPDEAVNPRSPFFTYSVDRVTSTSFVTKAKGFAQPLIEDAKLNPEEESFIIDHLYRFVNLPKMVRTKSEDLSWVFHCFPKYLELHTFEVARSTFDPFFKSHSTRLFDWVKMFKFYGILFAKFSDVSEEMTNYFQFLSSQFMMYAHKHISHYTTFFRNKIVTKLKEFHSPTCHSDFSLLESTQQFQEDLSSLESSPDLEFFDLKGTEYPPPSPSSDPLERMGNIFLTLLSPLKITTLVDETGYKSSRDFVFCLHPTTICLDMLLRVGLQTKASVSIIQKEDFFQAKIHFFCTNFDSKYNLENVIKLLVSDYDKVSKKLKQPQYSGKIYLSLIDFYLSIFCSQFYFPKPGKTAEIEKHFKVARKLADYYPAHVASLNIKFVTLTDIVDVSKFSTDQVYKDTLEWLNFFHDAYTADIVFVQSNEYELLDANRYKSLFQNAAMVEVVQEFHLYIENKNRDSLQGSNESSNEKEKTLATNDLVNIYIGLSQTNSFKADGMGKLLAFFSDKTTLFYDPGMRQYFGNVFLSILVKSSSSQLKIYSAAMNTFFENSLIFLERRYMQLKAREGEVRAEGNAGKKRKPDADKPAASKPNQKTVGLESVDNLCSALAFVAHQHLVGYRTHYSEGLDTIVQYLHKFETSYISFIMQSRFYADFLAFRCCAYIIARDTFHAKQSLREFFSFATEADIRNVFLKADFVTTLLEYLKNEVSIYPYETLQIHGVYIAEHRLTTRLVSSTKPTIMDCIEFMNSFQFPHSFLSWFLNNYSSNASYKEAIFKAEIGCPGSSCFCVIFPNGTPSRYLYCFNLASMQVYDNITGVVYQVPSFNKRYDMNKRNHLLQHFSYTLLLDVPSDKKLLYYKDDTILAHFDSTTGNYVLSRNELFEMFPDIPNPDAVRYTYSRVYRSDNEEVFSVVYEMTDIGKMYEIFPRFLYNGKLLFGIVLGRVYNVKSVRYMQIEFGDNIYLTYIHQTKNRISKGRNEAQRKEPPVKEKYDNLFNISERDYVSQLLNVFMVTEESIPGYTGIIYCASERKYEVYLAVRYFSQKMYKFAWLKLKDIHNMFEFNPDEIDLLLVFREQLFPEQTDQAAARGNVERRVFKFYIEYMLFMNYVSFSNIPDDCAEFPPEPNEILELWALIPLYMKPTIYNAIKVIQAMLRPIQPPTAYRQPHKDSCKPGLHSFAPYHEDILEKCKKSNYVATAAGSFNSDFTNFYYMLSVKPNTMEDVFKHNLCYMIEDAYASKVDTTPAAPILPVNPYDDVLLLTLKKLLKSPSGDLSEIHIGYQTLFGDVFFANFRPVVVNAYKLGTSRTPADHPIHEFSSLIDLSTFETILNSKVAKYESEHVERENKNEMTSNNTLPLTAEQITALGIQDSIKREIRTFIALTNMRMFPRFDQVRDVALFLDKDSASGKREYKHLFLSKLMGGGKTAVIGPILGGLVKTDGTGLSVMVYIPALFQTNSRDIQQKMPFAGVYVYGMEFQRYDHFFTPARLEYFYRLILDAKERGNVICTKLNTLQSFFNRFHEYIHDLLHLKPSGDTTKDELAKKEKEDALRWILKIILFFRSHGLLTIDETDRALDPAIEVNYPLKTEIEEADPLKIEIISYSVGFLRFDGDPNKDIFATGGADRYVKLVADKKDFVQLLSDIFTKVIVDSKMITKFLDNTRSLYNTLISNDYLEALVDFCFYATDIPSAPFHHLKQEKDETKLDANNRIIEQYMKNFKNRLGSSSSLADLYELFNFLRRFLSDWLYEASKKRINEEYGHCPYKEEEKTTHDLWEAIPYEAADTPAIFSRFSSPYWLITLTFVMFQKEGVRNRLEQFLNDIKEEIFGMLFERYGQKNDMYYDFLNIVTLLAGMKKLDYEHFQDDRDKLIRNFTTFFQKLGDKEDPLLNDLFENNNTFRKIIINFAMKKMKDRKFNAKQINSLSFDVYGYFKSMNGYSGTLGSHYMYPRNSRIVEIKGELGAVTQRIVNYNDTDFQTFSLMSNYSGHPEEKFFDKLTKSHRQVGVKRVAELYNILQNFKGLGAATKEYNVILDACAHFRGISNLEVANILYKCYDHMGVRPEPITVTFRDDGTLIEYSASGEASYSSPDTFSKKNTASPLPIRCVYHPQTKCTGIDIKYLDHSVGLLISDKDTLADRFKQAAFRLRNINRYSTNPGTPPFIPHSLKFAINTDLLEAFQRRYSSRLAGLAGSARSALTDKHRLLITIMENEVRSFSRKAESVIFKKLKTELRCLFLDILSELSENGEFDFLPFFKDLGIQNLWERIFFKKLSVDFPKVIDYTMVNTVQTAQAESTDMSEQIDKLKGKISKTKIGSGFGSYCDKHKGFLKQLIDEAAVAGITGTSMSVKSDAAIEAALGSTDDQEIAQEKEEEQVQQQQLEEEQIKEQDINLNEENMIRYEIEYTALRERFADYSSLDAFINSLSYRSYSLESVLYDYVTATLRGLHIPQFTSKIYLSYYFWRFCNEFDEPSTGLPEKVNSSLFVCWNHGALRFWMMSSLQTRTACKKLGHELGFAVVSPLGDLIYSPHDSLEAFFDFISKKHRGLRSKKAFNESLDHDYNVAIFQSILYNGLMFSLERFCNSSSVLTTRDRYRSFIQWLDPPRGVFLGKNNDTPFGQLWTVFCSRNLSKMYGFAPLYKTTQLFRGSVNDQLALVGKAYDNLESSKQKMKDLFDEFASFRMLSTFQRHYKAPHKKSLWLWRLLVQTVYGILWDDSETIDYPKAEMLLDILLSDAKDYRFKKEGKKFLIERLIYRAHMFNDITDKWFVLERTIRIAEMIDYPFSSFEKEIAVFISSNINRIFDSSVGSNTLARLFLFEKLFPEHTFTSIVSVNGSLVRALISSLSMYDRSKLNQGNFIEIFSLDAVKKQLFSNYTDVISFVTKFMTYKYLDLLMKARYNLYERLTILIYALFIHLQQTKKHSEFKWVKKELLRLCTKTPSFPEEHSRLLFLSTEMLNTLFRDELLNPKKEHVILNVTLALLCRSIVYYDISPSEARRAIIGEKIHPYLIPRMQRDYSQLIAADEVKFRHVCLTKDQIVENFIWHMTNVVDSVQWDLHWKFIVRYQVYLELFHLIYRVAKEPSIHQYKPRISFIALKFFSYLSFVSERSFLPNLAYCASICQILTEHYSRKQTLSRLYDTVISQHYLKERPMLGMELMIYLQNKVFGGLRTVQLMKAHHTERPQNQKYDQMYIKTNSFSAALFRKDFLLYSLVLLFVLFGNLYLMKNIKLLSRVYNWLMKRFSKGKAVGIEPSLAAEGLKSEPVGIPDEDDFETLVQDSSHITVYCDEDFEQYRIES